LLSIAVAVLAAPAASGNGSAYSPGLSHGWDGVLARGGDVRYVTLGTTTSTVVAAIGVRGGRVLRTRTLKGMFGIPLVAYDGTTGGLSGDGRLLVVASYGPSPGTAGATQFVVLATRSLRPRYRVQLPGSWSYDASSPDGRTIFLVEHISAGPNPRYRVRVFDLETGRLGRGAIVDRLEKESVMGGQPVTRATSPDGRWAYTLYARPGEPFVHALDTARSEAYCIDLPLRLGEVKQWGLRLGIAPDGTLAVRRGRSTVAVVNTKTFIVRRS
jgi:hypothetical protein